MRVTINDREVNIPSSLGEITLQQWAEWEREQNDPLKEMWKSIQEMDNEIEREIEEAEWHREKMYRWISFFSGFTVDNLKESQNEESISSIYIESYKVLVEDFDNMELQNEYVFKNDIWVIPSPELKYGDDRKVGQFTEAKQTVVNLSRLGANEWESLIPICAINLLKKGEKFDKSFIYEDSERQQLMKELPLNIAMQVGFFFLIIMNISRNTLQYSGLQK